MSERRAIAAFRAASQLTGLQRSIVVSGINRGLSNNNIIDTMQAVGEGRNRALSLSAINELRGTIGNGEGINKTAGEFQLSEGVFRPSGLIPTGTFRAWAKYTVPNPTIDQKSTYTAVVTFDSLITRNELDAMIFDILSSAAETYGISIDPGQLSYTTAEIGL